MKMFRGAAVAAAIAGSMAAYNAQAVNLATDGIGEVAIAPFYTVRDGWSTLINLTNTQNVPVAVKVRFHEAHNSRDVLDFMVLLSAFDVFTGIVTEDSNGNAVFRSTDTPNQAGNRTCTIPTAINLPNGSGDLPNVGLSTAGYMGVGADNDKGQQNTDRLKEGYIEFIVMGYAEQDGNGVASLDMFDDNDLNGIQNLDVGQAIEEHVCDARLDLAFTREDNAATGQPEILNTAQQFGEPINALKFNFRLINVERGVEAGNSATTWANFYTPGTGNGINNTVTPLDNAGCAVWRGIERHNADVGTPVFRTGAIDWIPNAVDDGNYVNETTSFVSAGDGSCRNLIAEQQRQAFLEPTLNDAYPVVANSWDDQLNAALSLTTNYASMAPQFDQNADAVDDDALRGIDAMSATIMRRFVVNEWADNSAAGVSTDWILTQPTKAFYVDGVNEDQTITTNESIQTALAPERLEALVDSDADGFFEARFTGNPPVDLGANGTVDLPLAPYSTAWNVRAGQTLADACNEVEFIYYDRAEQKPNVGSSGVIISPQPPQTIKSDNVCHEATVINFNGASAFADAGSLAAPNRVNVDTSDIPGNALNGWMLLDLSPNGEALPVTGLPGGDTEQLGLPAIGFNLKVRSLGTGSAASNYASTLDHGYIRETN